MISFRPISDERHPVPVDPMTLVRLLSDLWQPGHFYLGNGLRCAWQFEAEETLPWEIFRGRLVEARQTRQRRAFRAWNLLPVIAGQLAGEPMLSLLLDEEAGAVHVTRGLFCYVWQTVEAGNVLESREATAWVRELVGSARLADFASREELVDELRCLVWQGVVGTSRLPLSSVEAPLPAFALGQMAYVPRAPLPADEAARPRRNWAELLMTSSGALARREQVKVLETVLRAISPDEVAAATELVAAWVVRLGLPAGVIASLVRGLFNDVSLSPYTGFADRTLELLAESVRRGLLSAEAEVDLLGFLIRQLARHLTAYDLVLFHYRGANYPDALLIDALLRRYFALARERGPLFGGTSADARRRRRALRQGCLVRRRYEGHAVPDLPTSPGENARVLPEPFARVPDEQILQPRERRRILFEKEPLTDLVDEPLRELLRQASADLAEPDEARELGMALFIDRPLGFHKAPAEADQTPLLSYEAYSQRLARQRLAEWRRLADELRFGSADDAAIPAEAGGVSLERIPDSPRPAVSLADARKVADDFRILHTTRSSAQAFWSLFDTTALSVDPSTCPLLLRVTVADGTRMQALDASGAVRLEFDADPSSGYATRAGVEFPRRGLRVVAPTEMHLSPCHLQAPV
jgi:hypothetical protein